jgi:flavin-dependent dehydrogenase
MSDVEQRDVIVIGGGPAGSTAATLLARQGHDVLLLERERFPRDHVGESMLPFCYKLFDGLGVLPKLRSSFVRKSGVRFMSEDGEVFTSWCFSHVIHDETYLSFQVNRAEFDTILLENAQEKGAEVRQETKVKDFDLGDGEWTTVRSADSAGVERSHRARFLIDASGRDAVIGTRKGWRKPREELDRTALWSHWTGVKMAGGLEEGMSLIIYMGGEKKGWIWIFPLSEDRITAGAVMNNSYLREQHRKLTEAGSSNWQQDLMMQELTASSFATSLLEGTDQALPVLVNGNYSYEVKNHYGTNYAMIGDARGFIDPIFSSGVFLSIKTAHLVSAAVHKRLTGDDGADEEMAQAYRQITGAYEFVHRMIRLFYNPVAVTWAQVGAEGEVHKAHESAMAAGHYMLAGDFFENHERYNKFFELLENPRGFQRYAKLVLEKSEFVDTSCHVPWDVAYGELGMPAGSLTDAEVRRAEPALPADR